MKSKINQHAIIAVLPESYKTHCFVFLGVSTKTNKQSVVPLVAIMGNHPNKVVQPYRTFANCWGFSQSSSAQSSQNTKNEHTRKYENILSAQASIWLVNQLLSTRFISTSKSTTPSMTGSVCSLNKFAVSSLPVATWHLLALLDRNRTTQNRNCRKQASQVSNKPPLGV